MALIGKDNEVKIDWSLWLKLPLEERSAIRLLHSSSSFGEHAVNMISYK